MILDVRSVGANRRRPWDGGAREPVREATGRHPDEGTASSRSRGGRDQPPGMRAGTGNGWALDQSARTSHGPHWPGFDACFQGVSSSPAGLRHGRPRRRTRAEHADASVRRGCMLFDSTILFLGTLSACLRDALVDPRSRVCVTLPPDFHVATGRMDRLVVIGVQSTALLNAVRFRAAALRSSMTSSVAIIMGEPSHPPSPGFR